MKKNEDDLPDEFLIKLGRIVTLWNGMEQFLGICIGKLSGFDQITDPRPYILINHSSFPQKLDNLSTLCEIQKDQFPHLENYPQTISLLKEAQKLRNKFIHNTISKDPETEKIKLAKGSARGKLKTEIIEVTINDLESVIRKFDEAVRSLWITVLNKDIGSYEERFREES